MKTEQKTKKRVDNYRTVDIKAEARAVEGEGKELILRGYPILFDTPTVINCPFLGTYIETVSRHALDKTDLSNVYLVVGHNPDNLLGRSQRNLRLEVDDVGLFMENKNPNTQHARDTFNLVEPGILDGMSFSFNSEGDTWQYPTAEEAAAGELPKRTINNITKLWEITITPFPAYGEASVIAMDNSRTVGQGEKTEQDEADKDKDEAAEKARADLDEKLKELESL